MVERLDHVSLHADHERLRAYLEYRRLEASFCNHYQAKKEARKAEVWWNIKQMQATPLVGLAVSGHVLMDDQGLFAVCYMLYIWVAIGAAWAISRRMAAFSEDMD